MIVLEVRRAVPPGGGSVGIFGVLVMFSVSGCWLHGSVSFMKNSSRNSLTYGVLFCTYTIKFYTNWVLMILYINNNRG